MAYVRNDLYDHLVAKHLLRAELLHRSGSPEPHPAWLWYVSSDGESTTFPGNLFQCFNTLWVKVFLTSNRHLSFFSLKQFHLALLLSACVNNCSLSSLYTPFKYWRATLTSPQSLLLSKNSLQPCTCIHCQILSAKSTDFTLKKIQLLSKEFSWPQLRNPQEVQSHYATNSWLYTSVNRNA